MQPVRTRLRLRGGGIGVETGRALNWGAGPNVVIPVLEAFQAARLEFAMEVSKLAVPDVAPGDTKVAGGTFEVGATEKVLNTLENSTTLMSDLPPLVGDLAPQVSECALVAIGRLGALSNKLNEKLAQEKVITQAIHVLNVSPSITHLKAALFQLTVATRKSEPIAQVRAPTYLSALVHSRAASLSASRTLGCALAPVDAPDPACASAAHLALSAIRWPSMASCYLLSANGSTIWTQQCAPPPYGASPALRTTRRRWLRLCLTAGLCSSWLAA